MFGALADTVDDLQVPLHRDALRELSAIRDRLDAKLSAAIGDDDAAGLYDIDGSVSMQAWLRHETGATSMTAARLTHRGVVLRHCAGVRDAFAAGRLTAGQIDVIAAHVPARHLQRLAEVEHELLPVLEGADVDATRVAMSRWRAAADAVDDGGLPAEHDDAVHLARTIDGRGELRASMSSDLTAVVTASLRVADCGDRDLTLAQRRADALGTVCRHFLDHQRIKPGGRHRPHIDIAVPADDFTAGTYLDTGGPVSPTELGVLACDSALHRLLVHGRSAILDDGRATRTAPVDLDNAIVARDQGCRWPGCDRPASWTDAHHVWKWDHDGPTTIDNLVLLCRRHHRKTHSTGWHLKLLPDATLELTHPDGRHQTTDPPGPIPAPGRRRRREAA